MSDEGGAIRFVTDFARAMTTGGFNLKRFRTVQRVAAILAPILVVSVGVWLSQSISWLDLCSGTTASVCDRPSDGYLFTLVALAAGGTAIGAALAVYLGRFARTGRMWRGSGTIGLAFLFLAAAWLVVYLAAKNSF